MTALLLACIAGEAAYKPLEAQCANCLGESAWCPFGYVYIQVNGNERMDGAIVDYCYGNSNFDCTWYYMTHFACSAAVDVAAMASAVAERDVVRIAALLVADPRWRLNRARGAIQAHGCDDMVIVSVPMSQADLVLVATSATTVAFSSQDRLQTFAARDALGVSTR